MLLKPKLFLARSTQSALRRFGRGGTSLPGKMLLRMEPNAIDQLSKDLLNGSVVISATNGKTTTATLLAQIFASAQYTPLHNAAGANMAGGIATVLMNSKKKKIIKQPDIGVFEVDEFWLEKLLPQLHPRIVLLGNLFRDQLDRFGELERIADRWLKAIQKLDETTKVVINGDDPLLGSLAQTQPDRCISYGLEDHSITLPSLPHAADSTYCRNCAKRLTYETIYLGHLGRYHCENCHTERPKPSVYAENIQLHGLRGSSFTLVGPTYRQQIELPLPGVYNIYNAVAAAAVATTLSIPEESVKQPLKTTAAAFGRGEKVTYDGCDLTLLLAKNPTGANEVLRTLMHEQKPLTLLSILNDRIADGGDVSWIWDVDYELLVPHIDHVICSGIRATEMALRWKYADLDPKKITVQPMLEQALTTATHQAANFTQQHLLVLPTYTAMLELRQVLLKKDAIVQTLAAI